MSMFWSSSPTQDLSRANGAAELSDTQIQRIADRVHSLSNDRNLEEMKGSLKSFILKEVESLGGQRVHDAASKERKEMLAAIAAMHSDLEMLQRHQTKVDNEQSAVNDSLQDQIKALQDRVTKLEQGTDKTLQDHTSTLVKLTTQGDDLQRQTDDSGRRYRDLSQRLGEHDKTLAEHDAKLKHHDELGRTLKDHFSKLGDHDKALSSLGERHGALSDQQAETGRRCERLGERHDELDARSGALAKRYDDLEEALGRQPAKVQEAMKKLEALSDLEGQVAQLRKSLNEESASRRQSISEVNSQLGKHVQDNADSIAANRTRIDDMVREQSDQIKVIVEKPVNDLMEKYQNLAANLPPRLDEIREKQADQESKLAQVRGLIGQEEQSRTSDNLENVGKLREVEQRVKENVDRYDELKKAILSEKQDRNSQAEDTRAELKRLITKEEQDRIEENTEQRTFLLKALRSMHERSPDAGSGGGGWNSLMSLKGSQQDPAGA